MRTLPERLAWLAKRAGSARQLSMMAGLNPSHIGVLLVRLRRDPSSNIEGKTLESIAKAGGVTVAWLLAGEGDPNGGVQTVAADRRAAAALLAKEDGVHEAAIAAVLKDPLPENAESVTTLEWARRMKVRELEMWRELPPRADDPKRDASGEMRIRRRTKKKPTGTM